MIVYQITNRINGKVYIGITNNAKKRWGNHCCNKKSLIGRAIQKYGKENFDFEILFSGLTIEEAEEKEIELIAEKKTLFNQFGYNIATGGRYNAYPGKSVGEANPSHILTEEEVRDIKDRRNLPMYVLYDDYSDRISYTQFKKIYRNEAWSEIPATVPEYPYNIEFSLQFTKSSLDYSDIVEMRELYSKGITPQEAYKKFASKANFQNFGNAYRGDTFKLVMPEVFTSENQHTVLSKAHSGENNGRSKLTKADVIEIRRRHEQDGESALQIHADYQCVSIVSIRNILSYKTWKNI